VARLFAVFAKIATLLAVCLDEFVSTLLASYSDGAATLNFIFYALTFSCNCRLIYLLLPTKLTHKNMSVAWRLIIDTDNALVLYSLPQHHRQATPSMTKYTNSA